MPTTSNFGWTTPADTDLVKDGAAAIRTLGNNIDASLVDLKGGTTGQILSKTSNTDLDYTWINNDQGDITEVQAGTGISVASGTGPVPVVTNTVATTFDAKGDLVVGTGADTFAKLTVGGTNDHVLLVDSSTSTGLKWGAVPASSPSYSLLNAGGTALTGAATVTVSGISAKNNILVVIDGASSANSGAYIYVRLNTDTGNNYVWAGGALVAASTYSAGVMTDYKSTSANGIPIAFMANNAGSVVSGYVSLDGCNSSGVKAFVCGGGTGNGGGNAGQGHWLGGVYTGTSTISSVSVFSNSGNLDAGTVYVYGA